MSRVERLNHAVECLAAWGEGHKWRGSDPYEGLNATRWANVLKRGTLQRRVLTQAVKRSPIDLRPALGISPEQTASAIALVISAYSLLGTVAGGTARLPALLVRLDRLRSPGHSLPCWGYHFDVQTRVFFYSKQTPNTIATAFAGRALLDAYRVTDKEELIERALGVGEFFLREVPQTESAGGAYFGYLPGDRTPIHNANMLVTDFLARLASLSGHRHMRAAAERGLRYTLAHQRGDGSWPYGEGARLAWIDNFHTGYVLESLMACRDAGLDQGVEAALRRGLQYYLATLFLPSGAPRYTPASTYPIDIQCVAQGIQVFALAGRLDPSFLEAAWRVLEYGLANLQRKDGAFGFQQERYWHHASTHIRWGQAPMLLAMAHLRRATAP